MKRQRFLAALADAVIRRPWAYSIAGGLLAAVATVFAVHKLEFKTGRKMCSAIATSLVSLAIVIFDMDGVLCDSEDFTAEAAAWAKTGIVAALPKIPASCSIYQSTRTTQNSD